jgi:hypothetical protein
VRWGEGWVHRSFLRRSELCGDLDFVCARVVPEDVLPALSIAEEDTFANVMVEFRGMFAGWADVDTATKRAKGPEVGWLAGVDFNRSGILTVVDRAVRNADEVVEGVGPKNRRQRGTFKERTHGVANGLVWAFGAAVLVGRVGPGKLDVVAGLAGEFNDGFAAAEFALVKTDVLAIAVESERVEPMMKVCEGQGLGAESLAEIDAAMMAGDDDIAGLAVEAQVGAVAGGVLGRLNDETEIDRYALEALGSIAGIVKATGGLAHFGGHASRALISSAGDGERRDTDGVLVHLGDTAGV